MAGPSVPDTEVVGAGAEVAAVVAAGAEVAVSAGADVATGAEVAGAEVGVAVGPQAVTSKLVRAMHTIKNKNLDFIGAPRVVSFWQFIFKLQSIEKRLFRVKVPLYSPPL
jgi:hypothetical protein